ncbi:hypothetical protein RO3G_15640 [Rhizopus delemar RA 99-880]|uniref:Rhodanese domain-containing protein n=3 Tax=Rhizopus TaxID=4842 RepID=I1CR49_RHIO9|nr:hypothetical protein RO3G_15640 [Rhizopus delemar RA 99-880]|eukprot:EIE90929.1 hypothetical protein RO3G_15640 [Rhizopus delemar RA 99-880]
MSTIMLTRMFFKQPSKVGSVFCPFNKFARREYTSTPKIIHYDDIQQLIKSDTQDYVLLDVREPKELEGGFIPTAKNVPLKQFHFAWDLSEKDFEENYGFEKPRKDEKMVTYCLKGIRSTSAADYLSKRGYKNVENYFGSFDDYLKKSKGEQD